MRGESRGTAKHVTVCYAAMESGENKEVNRGGKGGRSWERENNDGAVGWRLGGRGVGERAWEEEEEGSA